MSKDRFELNVEKLRGECEAVGYIYCYNSSDESEQKIVVDIEFDYSPEQKQTHLDPYCEADTTITRVACCKHGDEIDLEALDEIYNPELQITNLMQERKEDR